MIIYIILIIQKVIPRQIDRLYLLSYGRETTSWRKELKCEWKNYNKKKSPIQIPI